MSTNTVHKLGEETLEERYKRCGFLETVQHIDIYGRNRSCYVEHRLKTDPPLLTSVSNCSSKFTGRHAKPDAGCLAEKLEKLSVTTRVCGLYPGNDILSKKSKLRPPIKNNLALRPWK